VLTPLADYVDLIPNGGAGGGGGAGSQGRYSSYNHGAGAGGGGGGSITIQSPQDVTVGGGGRIDAAGGNGGRFGGNDYFRYAGAGGGGGGGGILLGSTKNVYVRSGATLNVAGGSGGAGNTQSSNYIGGRGGDGGDGWLCLASSDFANLHLDSGANTTYQPYLYDGFFPTGAGYSAGQTVWADLGVFDPWFLPFDAFNDISQEDYGYGDDTIQVWVQCAMDSTTDPGTPDLSTMDLLDEDGDGFTDDPKPGGTGVLSEWTPIENITDLNNQGYQHVRIRVGFNLPEDTTVDSAMPYVNFVHVRFTY
jgi:hypothetical protein